MKIAIISANLGRFDKPIPWFDQVVPGAEVSTHIFTDSNFPPRDRAMTPRLQAKIPKCFGWQLVPDCDVYIWVDASFALLNQDAAAWMVEQLEDQEMVVFKHPWRKTVGEEWRFLEKRIGQSRSGGRYLAKRYAHEIKGDWDDNAPLYAAGIFIYRPTSIIRYVMKDWWYYVTRFHLNDQLSLSTVLNKYQCNWNVIDKNIYDNGYFTFTRTREWLKK